MQEEAKTQASFPKENREQKTDRREKEKTLQAFAQARETGAEPKPGEPRAPELAPLITADRTKNRTGNEGAENRLRRDGSAEQERAAGTKMDQARGEASPITGEPFADQEGQGDRRDHGERDRQARGGRRHAEDLVREGNEPVDQRRRLQTRDAIVRRHEPLLRGQHFAGAAGELPFDAVIEIAPAGRGEMKDGREREEKNEKSVTGRRRIEHLRLEEGVFEREGASAGNHGDDSLSAVVAPLRRAAGKTARRRSTAATALQQSCPRLFDTDPTRPAPAATWPRASG